MSDQDGVPKFSDAESEIHFWKARVKDLQDTLKETESSLQDFMDGSRELEKEMDREISAAHAKTNELQIRAEKMKGDVDDWKSKYQRALSDHNKALSEMNREVSTLRESHNIYKSKLRDMELDNDELENAERMIASSLQDMEQRYNKAIERTALLEEELVEKSKLEEENQRLKDELRELNEEVAVLRDTMTNQTISRTNTPAEISSSNGRNSVDDLRVDDLVLKSRPRSRTQGGLVRPSSRTATYSPPSRTTQLPPIAQSASSSTRAPMLASRASISSHARHRSKDVTTDEVAAATSMAEKSSSGLRARQSIGGRVPARTPRYTTTPGARVQPGSSMKMMADMFSRMRALETRINSARTLSSLPPAEESAIPRPSSRLSNSIGQGGGQYTPRRSVDGGGRADTPSSIPVPSSGLSKSMSSRVRPSSRLSMANNAGSSDQTTSSSMAYRELGSRHPTRSRTPTAEMSGNVNLDFLEHDPKLYKRMSGTALGTGSGAANRPRPSTSGAGQQHNNTATMSLKQAASNATTMGIRRDVPPNSWRGLASTNSRPRSGSTGSR
ncbi:hypothetical protein FA10DRAFT_267229 [Acaromyces ingoldii]|uniref:NUDE domain-containing protein n=1 Tax=Acaromyces ingoldii TaxID=215250 RepID=A0A316YNJ7_9BASI|nr:hypothetical protein FA10DRAFT_267229 [Acaromyces ingoldii]PWN90791.1 hypothetical protein FA10DRAFT_267229 [Acaromyces ingoldii]